MKEKIAYLALSSFFKPQFFMKKVLLFAAAALAASTSFAQGVLPAKEDKASPLDQQTSVYGNFTEDVSKTTAKSDTGYLTLGTFLPQGFTNNYFRQIRDTSISSLVDRANPVDSGFFFGTNVFNNRGYAEKFYYDYGSDTTFRVIGALTFFTGKVKSTSTRQVTIGLWSTAARTMRSPKVFNLGLPSTLKVSRVLPATSIGVDTVKIFMFSNNGYQLSATTDTSFFMGYTIPPYTWSTSVAGDTFGLRSSRPGFGFGFGGFYNTANDTFYYNQNAYMNSGGTWRDLSLDYGTVRNLSILPLVIRTVPVGISKTGISNRGLTLFGNYPNPANEFTKVRFSLKNSMNGSITLTDISGRTLRSIDLKGLKTGENVVEINTSDLAAGNYIYILRTEDGAGMASQMTIVR